MLITEHLNWLKDIRLLICYLTISLYTVNVEIFAQYIFSCISRRAVDARKYDVSGKNEIS